MIEGSWKREVLAQEEAMEVLSVGVSVRKNHLEHMQKPWQGKKKDTGLGF